MNIIEIIDGSFLKLAEVIAKPLYKLTGIDNFGIATTLYVLGRIIGHWSDSLLFSKTTFTYLTPISIFLDILIWVIWIEYPKRRYRKNFLNTFRLQPYPTLRSLLLMSIFYSLIKLNYRTEYQGSILNVVGMAVQQLSFYLASIEPEDPSDSILKKLWREFGSLFQIQTQSQPA